MKDDSDEGFDFQTLQYNYHLLLQQQENMLAQMHTDDFNPCYNNSTDQAPLTSSTSFDPPPYISPFLMPPPPYSYGCSFSDPYVDMSISSLTDYDQAMTGSLMAGSGSSSSSLLNDMLSDEYEKMRAVDMMEAKALAASRSHCEAERRRRERINGHLAKLRSLLPNTTKTDKASLLTEVIQQVKDLKQQTSTISESSTVPTEQDELTFETCNSAHKDGQLSVKASLCCEDRPDLLQALIRTLKLFKLRTVKANVTTLGGRMRILLIIMAKDDETMCEENDTCSCNSSRLLRTVQEALEGVMGRSVGKDSRSLSGCNLAKRHRFKGADYC